MDSLPELTVSPSFARDSRLVADAGWLSFVKENIAKPFANAALVETHNAVTSSVNDIAGLVGSGPVLTDAAAFEVATTVPLTPEWICQTTSSVAGSLAPYLAAIALTRGGLSKLAGKSESLTASVLRHQTTGSVLGAGIYDGMRKPKENESRLGNALGGATAFLIFDGGNQLSRNLTGLQKWSARAAVGALGGTSHVLVADGIMGKLADSDRLITAAASGAALNVAMPALMERLLPSQAKQTEAPEAVPRPRTDTTAAAVGESGFTRRAMRINSTALQMSETSTDHLPPWLGNEGLVLIPDVHLPGAAMRPMAAEAVPQLPTSRRVSSEAIEDLYETIARAMREFRRSPDFKQVAEQHANILKQAGQHADVRNALLWKINADRSLAAQVHGRQLADPRFAATVLIGSPQAAPLFHEWQVGRMQIQKAIKGMTAQIDPLRRELQRAVNSLGEELGIPRVSVRFRLLGGKVDAEYANGYETFNIRLLTQKPLLVTECAGHETGHAYQEALVIRRIADVQGIGGVTSPHAVKQVQQALQRDLGQNLREKWVRSVLAMRDGVRLTDAEAEHASQLIRDWNKLGLPSERQIAAKQMNAFLRNPEVNQPVTMLLFQLDDPEVMRKAFPSGNMPLSLQISQEHRRLGRPLDTQENVEKLSQALRNLWEAERLNSYLRYQSAFHEQDAHNFQFRIRNVIQEMRGTRSSPPTRMLYGSGS